VLFTRALDREGLLAGIVGRAERLADPAAPDSDQPILLAVSDNGPPMTSDSTRESMVLSDALGGVAVAVERHAGW
jgi:hypothetical protein